MTTSTLANNLSIVQDKIALIAKRHQRAVNEVALIAVSKTRSIEEIRALAQHGQIDFAENYVQESVDKITKITDIPLTWHFIGPIQKNKTKLIAEHFHWVHSIDREIIAQRLNDQRPNKLVNLNVCMQINIDNESTKSGISAEKAYSLAEFIHSLPRLTLRGLMAIPSATDDVKKQTSAFKKMSSLLNELKQTYPTLDTLSMGMSNDFESAIANGSTMVRIGTALFGPRDYAN